jgi:hypothetical protein
MEHLVAWQNTQWKRRKGHFECNRFNVVLAGKTACRKNGSAYFLIPPQHPLSMP